MPYKITSKYMPLANELLTLIDEHFDQLLTLSPEEFLVVLDEDKPGITRVSPFNVDRVLVIWLVVDFLASSGSELRGKYSEWIKSCCTPLEKPTYGGSVPSNLCSMLLRDKVAGNIDSALPTAKEVIQWPMELREYNGRTYWLQSTQIGDGSSNVVDIYRGGTNAFASANVDERFDQYKDICGRPIITIQGLSEFDLERYHSYTLFSKTWAYLGGDRLLLNSTRGATIEYFFDEKSNNYQTSALHAYISGWLRELMNYNPYQDIIAEVK